MSCGAQPWAEGHVGSTISHSRPAADKPAGLQMPKAEWAAGIGGLVTEGFRNAPLWISLHGLLSPKRVSSDSYFGTSWQLNQPLNCSISVFGKTQPSLPARRTTHQSCMRQEDKSRAAPMGHCLCICRFPLLRDPPAVLCSVSLSPQERAQHGGPALALCRRKNSC